MFLFVSSSWASKPKHPTSRPGAKARVAGQASSSSHKGRHATASRVRTGKSTKKVVRGQQGIDGERASEIQSALIRAKYLDGEPSGVFDEKTKNALTKFQSDNGWQTKVLPDSRALIKLGLGPSNSGLLNPESAATSSTHQFGLASEVPGGSARR